MANIKVVKCDDGDYIIGMKVTREELGALQIYLHGTSMYSTECNRPITQHQRRQVAFMLAAGEDSLYYVAARETGVDYNG